MKTFKIIFAIILIISILQSCFQLVADEPHTGLMYPVIALVFLSLPAWMLYSAFKK